MAKITRRTGKMDRLGAVIGAIMSGIFVLIGFAIPAEDSFGGGIMSNQDIWYNEAGQIISGPGGLGGLDIFGAFKIGWIVICGALCIFCIYMAIKGEGIPTETIDVDSEGDPLIQVSIPGKPQAEASSDFEARLRKLEKLRADGLISDAEYREKRKQVMDEKW